MRFKSSILVLVLFGFTFAIENSDILKKIDDKRRIENLTFDMDITSFNGDKKIDEYSISGYMKSVNDLNKVLIYFTAPANQKERKMFLEGNYMWVLFPRTKNAIRLSPMQVLLGEASNGDVARTSFSDDYVALSTDSDTKLGKSCLKLKLKSKESRKGSTYGQIVLWVEKDSLLPVYAEFYTESGKLMKLTEYSENKTYGSAIYASRMDIRDANEPTKHTIMRYSKMGSKLIPTNYFAKEYLDRFTLE